MFQFSQNIDFLENALDVSLALLYAAFLNRFERVLLAGWITLTCAAVNLSEVASTEQGSHFELIFEI